MPGLEIDTTPRYIILPDDFNATYTLYSLVSTNFGGDAKNFICQGSYEYCEEKKEQMKALDELARLDQEYGLYDS